MSERFRLAANVLLKRRLNNLVRIDHQTEIDQDFITCAEYQLFIDEMRQQGQNRQPDHWIAEKFSDGEARKPVTGVRRSDAEEFCEWLTNREIFPEFSYRLPTIKETKEITAVSQNFGCWCRDNNSFIISGITAQQRQIWQQKLPEYFIFQDKNIIVDLDLDLNLNLNLNLNLDLDLNLDLNLNLDLDLDLNLDLDLDLNLDLYNEIITGKASNFLLLYFPLIVVILFYQSLTKIYAEAVKNRKIRQKLELNRQECEQKSQEYAQKQDNIFQLYAYFVLMDQRQKGNMPAWEGIRIVRERKETE